MEQIPSFLEDDISKMPALQVLINMGWEYLTPKEALALRNNKKSGVLLEPILEDRLRAINQITFRGESFQFSDSNLQSAKDSLRNYLFDGLVRTNEKIYDLLTLGRAMQQTIIGDTKSFTLNFIDWKNPQNNKYHVTQEFEVERTASWETRRPDIVLFVNGIPLVVIECKRPDLRNSDPIEEAISQHIRNQKDENIPKLFVYSQILLGLATNQSTYATAGTPAKFWAQWREEENIDESLKGLIAKKIAPDIKKRLFEDSEPKVKRYFDDLEDTPRLPTEQDRTLYSICRPERLLELTFQYVVYDEGEKKIARYQQYFAVKEALRRITQQKDSNRQGGVVWHTQGSGKSITMVMLAKAIALCPAITNPRIVLVTDRTDLDDQIYGTFKSCGLEPQQAKTGAHLIELLGGNKAALVTTIINKFHAGLKGRKFSDPSANIFVLVDESHRTQYGTMNVAMQKVYPNACYIAFTGTPLSKAEKNTAQKFGGFIGKPYKLDDAVRDEAVVPILYEGRHVPQTVNDTAIDKWFERVTETLSDDQKKDLKKKFSTSDKLNEAEQKVKVEAYDIAEHFRTIWKGTGFKGQLVAQNKRVALLFKKFLDESGHVTSQVLISGPDTREGHDDIYDETHSEVQVFWKKMMEKYGSDENYNKSLINAFKKSDEPEIIIVVEKLLTGFDAPRNVVLYLTTNLKEHTLLQAIARVNRLCEGKECGYVLDYYGVIENLDNALTQYRNWNEFDAEDIGETVINVSKEVAALPQRYSDLWDVFKTIKNKSDNEEYERFLSDEAIRHRFYEKLSVFGRTLQIALSTVEFSTKTPPETVAKYKKDLKFFLNLRASAQRRYAEKIDFKEYEGRIQKLVDTYVSSDEVMPLTDLVNIFDQEKFQREVAKVVGDAAKADTIASRTKKTITEKMEEDPAFYKKFSALLEAAIEAFREKRITEAQYLAQVANIMESVRNRTDDEIPEALRDNDAAKAFYGTIAEALKVAEAEPAYGEKANLAIVALEIDRIIRNRLVVDWTKKPDVMNQIKNDIDDYLFELKKTSSLELSVEQIDHIMEQSLDIAKHRYAR
jgi:type I restriction enzyme R subunit